MGFHRIRTTLVIGLLAATAVWLNLHAPTLFFDTQMMIGGSLGIFALLQFGWPGLVVGLAALAVTYVRWGHPFELIVGTGFLVWLQFFLVRFNGGRTNRGNGRILLAAVAYWLLLGFWLEVAFFGVAFGMDAVGALGLGLKETVTSLSNVTFGFLLFAVVHAAQHGYETGGIRPRELTVGLVLASVTLPAMFLVYVLSLQVKDATLHALLTEMQATGAQAASLVSDDAVRPAFPIAGGRSRHFAVRRDGGIIATSAPELFARLARDYVEEAPSRTGNEGLRIYRPKTNAAVITSDAESYLFTEVSLPATAADLHGLQVTVVEPLNELVNLLDYQLILPSFSVILGFLVAGAVVGSVVDTVSYRRMQAEQSAKEAEAAIAAAREQERLQEDAHRRDLAKKLRTSLNAAAIAHEINQPLSRVILRARMGMETVTGASRDMLAALVADAERVVSVIEKMKVLLRNVETVKREVNLAAVTASGLHQVKRPLCDAGVTVIRRGLDGSCLVLGDDVQLQLIIINLVTNAVEAIVTAKSPRREIEVALHASDGAIELVVGDSGSGWPGGTLDDVLLSTTKAGGAGVGLYVVKTAVENHKGQIAIGRSSLGGAELRITLARVNERR